MNDIKLQKKRVLGLTLLFLAFAVILPFVAQAAKSEDNNDWEAGFDSLIFKREMKPPTVVVSDFNSLQTEMQLAVTKPDETVIEISGSEIIFSNPIDLSIPTNSIITLQSESGVILKAAPGSRHFTINGNLSLNLNHIVFDGNNNGGGIELNVDGRLELEGGLFQNHFINGNGGAIWVGEAASLDMRNSAFSHNTALSGGAVYLEAGITLPARANTQTEATASPASEHNSTSAEIYVDNFLNSSFDSCTFLDNRSTGTSVLDAGGALFSRHARRLHLLSCVFTDNKSVAKGGAIYVTSGITNSTFYSALLELEATNMTDNSCGDEGREGRGGAIFGDAKCKINIFNGGLYEHNYVSEHVNSKGGALFLGNNGLIFIYQDVTFQNNGIARGDNLIRAYNGGALYLAQNGQAGIGVSAMPPINGNGITVGGKVVFSGNHSANNGGAIFCENASTLHAQDNIAFLENHAEKNGGAIFFERFGQLSLNGKSADLLLQDNTAGANGGAIYSEFGIRSAYTAYVHIQNSVKFRNNYAELNGGAMYANDSVNIDIHANMPDKSVEFSGNTAKKEDGGALCYDSLNGVALFDVYLNISGYVTAFNNQARYGGGFFIASDDYVGETSLKIEGPVKIYNNRAQGYGGGLAIRGILTNASISGKNGYAEVYGNILTGNASTIGGGGIYIDADTLSLKNGVKIYQNRAAGLSDNVNGGGIASGKGAEITASGDVQIYGNYALNDGGAIYCDPLKNAPVNPMPNAQNTASLNSDVSTRVGTERPNTVSLGDATDNADQYVRIAENTAGNNGGGICYSDGYSVFLYGYTKILDNHAEMDGGAIWTDQLKSLNAPVSTVRFIGNTARAPYYLDKKDAANLHDLHQQNIKTQHFSEPPVSNPPFSYVYNNYDVVYATTVLLSFDSDGGNPTPDAIEVDSGARIGNASMPPSPVLSGYLFGGWFTGKAGQGDQFTGDTPIYKSQTVFARWIEEGEGFPQPETGDRGATALFAIAFISALTGFGIFILKSRIRHQRQGDEKNE